jgi:hypothetical protein
MQFAKGTMMELLTAPKAEHMVAKLFREPSMQKTVRCASIAAHAILLQVRYTLCML